VFVCTGNRFRSPLAAALFSDAVTTLPVVVRSVGTLDAGNPRAFSETLEHAHRFGLDLSGHRAQPLGGEDVTDADVVIGFEQVHVAVAVMQAGVHRDRAFTLPELVELLELAPPAANAAAAPPAQARAAIEHAAETRAVSSRTPGTPELPDPVGQSQAHYTRAADAINDLVTRLVRELFR
jgi:protein-tyrosine-phosphatase